MKWQESTKVTAPQLKVRQLSALRSQHNWPNPWSRVALWRDFLSKRQIVHGLVTCLALPVTGPFVAPTSWRGLRRVWRRSVWPTWPSEWNRVRSVALKSRRSWIWRAALHGWCFCSSQNPQGDTVAKEEWSNRIFQRKLCLISWTSEF